MLQSCSTAWKQKEQLQRRLMASSIYQKTLQWLTCSHLSSANDVHVVEAEWSLEWQNGNNKCTHISFRLQAYSRHSDSRVRHVWSENGKKIRRTRGRGKEEFFQLTSLCIVHRQNGLSDFFCLYLWFVFNKVQNNPVYILNHTIGTFRLKCVGF